MLPPPAAERPTAAASLLDAAIATAGRCSRAGRWQGRSRIRKLPERHRLLLTSWQCWPTTPAAPFTAPGTCRRRTRWGRYRCGGGGGGCAAAAVVCGGRGSAAEWCGVGCCPLLPSASVRHPPSLWSCQCPSAPPLLSCLQTLLTTTSPLPLPFSYPSMFCPLPFALQTLLITDSLFRTTDLRRRKKCVALVDEVTAGAPPQLVVWLGSWVGGWPSVQR